MNTKMKRTQACMPYNWKQKNGKTNKENEKERREGSEEVPAEKVRPKTRREKEEKI